MRTHLAFALAALALVVAGVSRADAQGYFGPNQGPTYGPGYRGNISPYLNLFRGQNTGIDYYLGTRSEFQRRFDARQFRDQIDELDRREAQGFFEEGAGRELPLQSGTPATFGNTLGYYYNRQNYIGQSVGRMGPGGVAVPAPPPSRGGRR
jgi:hypothetical protein